MLRTCLTDFVYPPLLLASLLPADQLLDLRQQDVMAWRREGEDYEPPESEEEDDDDEGMASDDVETAEGGSVSMAELAAG
jgi:hypothetical protein